MSKASSDDSQIHISHLQLDDLSVLRVLDDGTVAGKLFFQRLDDAFFVKLLRDSLSQKWQLKCEYKTECSSAIPPKESSNIIAATYLNRGEGFASVPLLDSDVNEWVAVHTPSHIVFVNIERVEVCKVLNAKTFYTLTWIFGGNSAKEIEPGIVKKLIKGQRKLSEENH